MFPIEFYQDEKIELVEEHARLLEDETDKEVCVVITNSRLFLFEDGNRKSDSKEVLRITRAISPLPSYEKLLEVELSFIKEIEDGDYNKYILQNGNYFYLQNNTVYQYLKENQ